MIPYEIEKDNWIIVYFVQDFVVFIAVVTEWIFCLLESPDDLKPSIRQSILRITIEWFFILDRCNECNWKFTMHGFFSETSVWLVLGR